MRWMLLAWLLSIAALRAQPPDILQTSPDQKWQFAAHWVTSNSGGYAWTLKNRKTGRVYFDDKRREDEALPRWLEVLWSPGGHYLAINVYYGRAVAGAMVVPLIGAPELIDPLSRHAKVPLERTLLRPEDVPSFLNFTRLVTAADSWKSDTDLIVNISMLASLKGESSRNPIRLDTTWHQTVHLDGKSARVTDSVCDSYDKRTTDQ